MGFGAGERRERGRESVRTREKKFRACLEMWDRGRAGPTGGREGQRQRTAAMELDWHRVRHRVAHQRSSGARPCPTYQPCNPSRKVYYSRKLRPASSAEEKEKLLKGGKEREEEQVQEDEGRMTRGSEQAGGCCLMINQAERTGMTAQHGSGSRVPVSLFDGTYCTKRAAPVTSGRGGEALYKPRELNNTAEQFHLFPCSAAPNRLKHRQRNRLQSSAPMMNGFVFLIKGDASDAETKKVEEWSSGVGRSSCAVILIRTY
ncbi:hypothetical protein BC827DRAFT_1154926 [Russula dissimulans]|nr:hypothetical protein BC827DRAFT_1154926 [Russula dissimulans]